MGAFISSIVITSVFAVGFVLGEKTNRFPVSPSDQPEKRDEQPNKSLQELFHEFQSRLERRLNENSTMSCTMDPILSNLAELEAAIEAME